MADTIDIAKASAPFCPLISVPMMLPVPSAIQSSSPQFAIQFVGFPCQGVACLAYDDELGCRLIEDARPMSTGHGAVAQPLSRG